jgi:hypothetical protein
MPANPPALGRVAFLPFCAPRSRRIARAKARFRPPSHWHVVHPRRSAVGFIAVRLRVSYFRYVDGPQWARQIHPQGSIQCLFSSEAQELLASGLAELPANEDPCRMIR